MSQYIKWLTGTASAATLAEGACKAVVITGGSRGLGYALADRFLTCGDAVLLTSRTQDKADAAVQRLREQHGEHAQVHGAACDARDWQQMQAVATQASALLGRIDIWVNNAALSQKGKVPIHEADAAVLASVVDTNLLGSMLGAKAAISVMRGQAGGGQVWLVDGTGAWGNPTPGNAAYGATKRGLTQLLKTLKKETSEDGKGVTAHMFSPGMIATDLLFSAVTNARGKKFINILAEPPESVAAWLVPRIKGVKGNGQYIKYLTTSGVLWRLLTARSRKNRFLLETADTAAELKKA